MTIPLDDRRTEVRREDDQQSLVRNIGIALAVLSLVGSVFAAGYNWRSIDNLERSQNDYVRKDVQQEQFQRFGDKLQEISRQLEEIRGEARLRRQP